jgi:hypothetical protein
MGRTGTLTGAPAATLRHGQATPRRSVSVSSRWGSYSHQSPVTSHESSPRLTTGDLRLTTELVPAPVEKSRDTSDPARPADPAYPARPFP